MLPTSLQPRAPSHLPEYVKSTYPVELLPNPINPAPAVPPKSSSNFSLSSGVLNKAAPGRGDFSLRFLKAVSLAASSGGSPVSLQPVRTGTPTEAPDGTSFTESEAKSFWLGEWPTGLCPLPALWRHRPRRHSKSPHGCMSTCARTPMTRHRPVQMPDLMWPPGLQLFYYPAQTCTSPGLS